MRVTKYEHSCLDIELGDRRLLIDPGIVSSSIPNYENIEAVIITHVHADHFDPIKVQAIYAQNPSVVIYTVQDVSNELQETIPHHVVSGGMKVKAGSFQLEFFGGQHAVIHNSVPIIDNVGVMINNSLYYPGDSLTVPNTPINTLALPISAPWLKISEAMDFLTTLKPEQVFPVHDALLSDFGMQVNSTWLKIATDAIDTKYIVLSSGESITI